MGLYTTLKKRFTPVIEDFRDDYAMSSGTVAHNICSLEDLIKSGRRLDKKLNDTEKGYIENFVEDLYHNDKFSLLEGLGANQIRGTLCDVYDLDLKEEALEKYLNKVKYMYLNCGKGEISTAIEDNICRLNQKLEDGLSENYSEIIRKYRWKKQKHKPPQFTPGYGFPNLKF